jgi:hypothetical protein
MDPQDYYKFYHELGHDVDDSGEFHYEIELDKIGFRGRRDNKRKGDCLLIACLSSRNSEPK